MDCCAPVRSSGLAVHKYYIGQVFCLAMSTNPNILFFFSDQHRFDWLGSNPDIPVRTPNIDRLSRLGVQFENAICPAPLCAPSRACLASGMAFDRCGVPNNYTNYPVDGWPRPQPTYYERLRDEANYHVMGCGKLDLQKATFNWGKDGKYLTSALGFSEAINNADKSLAKHHVDDVIQSEQQHDPYTEYLREQELLDLHIKDFSDRSLDTNHPTPLPDEAYIDNWIARNGLDLLNSAPEGKPWHLVVNFAGPHSPFDPTEEMHSWYRGDNVTDFPGPIDTDDRFSSETHNEIRRNYAAMIENLDRWIGVYLEKLEKRGELDDTIVVYSSDHGEMLGDHGRFHKGSPYQPSVGVPLIVSGPGVEQRGSVEELANLIDLHATFLDYAGISTDNGRTPARPSLGCAQRTENSSTHIDTKSVRPYLEGETDMHREYLYAGLDSCTLGSSSTMQLIFDGRYKLIEGWTPRDNTEPPVLFDHKIDPHETCNVASENPDVVSHLRERISE